MKHYLMTLTPQEPYFFGNEKTFLYPGAKNAGRSNRYYIKSELTPAQTTWIGALRYLLLPVKKQFADYTNEDKAVNAEAVGPRSFEYGGENKFGKIKGISPIFLLRNGNEPLVVTPMDHQVGRGTYTPFSNYREIDGDRCYTTDYDAKAGIAHSYMSLKNGEIVDTSALFTLETRIGINRSVSEKGFFKKTYVTLAKECSFAAYVTLADGVTPQDSAIYLGQGKSLFVARFTEVAEDAYEKMTEELAGLMCSDVICCMSDAFLPDSTADNGEGIYAGTKFAVTDLRDYRAYTTNDGEIKKHGTLYRLIKAGSIFIPKNESFVAAFKDENVQVIGYNETIKGKKEREK